MREAVAADRAGNEGRTKPPGFPVPEELKEKSAANPRFKRAFEPLTRRVGKGINLFHFRRRKSSLGTRTADREGDACDLRRTRVPGAAIDRENCGCVPRDRLLDVRSH